MENVIDKGIPRTGSAGIDVEKILGPSPLKKVLRLVRNWLLIVPGLGLTMFVLGSSYVYDNGFLSVIGALLLIVACVFGGLLIVAVVIRYFKPQLFYMKTKKMLTEGMITADFYFNPAFSEFSFVILNKTENKILINGELWPLDQLKRITSYYDRNYINATVYFKSGEKPAAKFYLNALDRLNNDAEYERLMNYLGWS